MQFIISTLHFVQNCVTALTISHIKIHPMSTHSPQYELLSSNEFISLSYQDRQLVSRPIYQYLLTTFAAVYMIVDIAWMFAVWSAASVGKFERGSYLTQSQQELICSLFAVT